MALPGICAKRISAPVLYLTKEKKMSETKYVKLSVEIHGNTWRSPEEWKKEIYTHVRIRHDPDYDSDVVVEIEETSP